MLRSPAGQRRSEVVIRVVTQEGGDRVKTKARAADNGTDKDIALKSATEA